MLTQGERPEELRRGARVAARTGGRRPRRRRGRQRLGAERAAGRRPRRRAATDDVGIPAGRNSGVPHVARRAAVLPRRRREPGATPDALARVAREVRGRPAPGARAAARRPAPSAAPSRATGCRGCASATARAAATSRTCGRARWRSRGASFEAVGGWPAAFRFVHEGVDLGWRVMDAGYRVHYAGDVAALHPPYAPAAATSTTTTSAPATASGSPAGTSRGRWASSTPGRSLLRTVPRLDSGAKRRAALRGYRDGARGPYPGRQAAERADARAHDAARAAPGLLSTVRA